MEQQKVDMFLAVNSKFFESHLIPQIHDMLLKADDSRFLMLQSANFRDPTTILIVSLFWRSLRYRQVHDRRYRPGCC